MDHENIIITGILQNPSRIASISNKIDADFFENGTYKNIYKVVKSFFKNKNGKNFMDVQLLENKLNTLKPSKAKTKMLEFLLDVNDCEIVLDPIFEESISDLIQARKKKIIIEGNAEAANSLVEGNSTKAMDAMRDALVVAEGLDDHLSIPVDIRTEKEFKISIQEIDEDNGKTDEKLFISGFDYIDDRVYFDREHLTIIGGSPGDGKTSISREIAYRNVMNGYSVLFIPLEMSRREMRTQFICRHARTLDPSGVRWVEVLKGKRGNLTDKERKLYESSYQDWIKFEKAGQIFLWESSDMERNMSEIEGRIRYMVKHNNIDIVIVDYLELVKPKDKSRQYRLDMTQIAKDFKSLARDEKIWVIVPHQISRLGRDRAEKRKDGPYYVMRDLGESSGIEKSADSILWIYKDGDLESEKEAIVGCMKSRFGKTITKGIRVFADFEKSSIFQVGKIKKAEWSE